MLNPKLRIIRSRDGIQWIIQRQNSKRDGEPIWSSFAYCATKGGLILRIKEHLQPREAKQILTLEVLASRQCDPEAWRAVIALPDYFPKEQH